MIDASEDAVFRAEYIKASVSGTNIRLTFDIDKSLESKALRVLGGMIGDGNDFLIGKPVDGS